MHPLLLARHGETEWSLDGRHTSVTDIELTEHGEEQARALAPALRGWEPVLALSSPRIRARFTATIAGFGGAQVDQRLVEWDYGIYEGRTSADIHRDDPTWDLWAQGCPGGESPRQVAARLDALLADLAPVLQEGPVVCFAHGHVLRSLAARWLGQDIAYGRLLALDPARWCALGWEHDGHVIRTWNST